MLADLPFRFRRLQPIERLLVRYTGYSLSSWYVTPQAKVPYVPTLLLTTIGQHSRELRNSPLFYFWDAGAYLVVGSQSGAPRDPAWVGNLRANPQALVRVQRRRVPVRAEFLSGGSERGPGRSSRAPGLRTTHTKIALNRERFRSSACVPLRDAGPPRPTVRSNGYPPCHRQ